MDKRFASLSDPVDRFRDKSIEFASRWYVMRAEHYIKSFPDKNEFIKMVGMMFKRFFQVFLIVLLIINVSACKIEGSVEASGGLYTEENQNLSK